MVFVASRVAQTVIARGLPPAPALAHGYDLALRRVPSLTRLLVLGGAVTAPFWIGAIFLPFALAALTAALPALWLYAALTRLVGADGRLRGGDSARRRGASSRTAAPSPTEPPRQRSVTCRRP